MLFIWGTKNIECPLDLAKRLELDPRALSYVTLVSPTTKCKHKGCGGQSIVYNHGYCICCAQLWFPRKEQIHRNNSGARGHFLLGPAFQRCESPNMSARTACCCMGRLCYGMGYTDSVFYFPADVVIRQQWYAVMESGGIISNDSKRMKQIDKNPTKFCLAWWHFSPDHLEKHG